MSSMEDKKTLTVVGIVLAGATFVSGVIGGWIGSQTSIARLETRVEHLEKQRTEDQTSLSKQLDYWRAQQESTGRDVAAIKAIVERDERRRR